MKAHLRTAVSIVALALVAGTSGSALASSLETQHSIYDRAAQSARMQVQAGPAGPSRISGRHVASWPTESQFSVYHLTSLHDDAPTAQAGPAGPTSIEGAGAASRVSEVQHSIYDH